jgi:hypothetical protein
VHRARVAADEQREPVLGHHVARELPVLAGDRVAQRLPRLASSGTATTAAS